MRGGDVTVPVVCQNIADENSEAAEVPGQPLAGFCRNEYKLTKLLNVTNSYVHHKYNTF